MEFIEPYWNYIITAAIVLVALVVLIMIMRAFGGRVRGRKGKRLGVSEYRELDQSRRLMLVRRDDVEHLILVGGGQSLVIEQNIGAESDDHYTAPSVSYDRQSSQLVDDGQRDFEPQPRHEPDHRPAPRAPIFSERPPNIRPARREEPGFNNDDY